MKRALILIRCYFGHDTSSWEFLGLVCTYCGRCGAVWWREPARSE